MTFVPSVQQAAFFEAVKNTSDNIILEAVAGAGKTTTLIEGVKLMKGRVFLGAYNSEMARELKSRVALLERTGVESVFASTFHSAGFRQLKFSYKQHALRVDDKKCDEIATDIAKNGREDLLEYVAAVTAIVSMAKQRGLGIGKPLNLVSQLEWETMIYHFGLDENLPENARMDKVVAFAKVVLSRSNSNLAVIDYDDMCYLPLLFNLRMLTHEWVLIDEAQDTNPVRRALARKMLAPGGRLIAVGDPHQAIFGFTGADNDSLNIIQSEFNCVKMPLTVSYRCPQNVVAHARQFVSHIEAHPDAPEGEVLTMDYEEAEFWNALRLGDAILCRTNKHLVRTFFKLVREGKPAKIEGKAVGQGLASLAGKWKIKSLDTLADRLETYRGKEVAKAMAAKQERRAEHIDDQVETLFVLIKRAKELKMDVDGLVGMIGDMFADKVASSGEIIVLCSTHRSKGLEWNRVFLLGRTELMPSKFARQEWQVEQEINLIYVAITRAKQLFVDVYNVDNERRSRMYG